MVAECNYCGKDLGKSYAKCGKCGDKLHFGDECSGIKKADWESLGPVKKLEWHCNFCVDSIERPAGRPTRPSNAEKKGEIGYNEDESENNNSDAPESNDDEDYSPKGKKRRSSRSPKKPKAKPPARTPKSNTPKVSNDEVIEVLTQIKTELQGLGSLRKELTDLRKSFDLMSKKYDDALEEIKQMKTQQNDTQVDGKVES